MAPPVLPLAYSRTAAHRPQINATSIRRPTRKKHYTPPPVFLPRARGCRRGANLNPGSVHALLLLQILLAARRALTSQFRATRFMRIRVAHQHHFRPRIALQTHSHVVQIALAHVVRARAARSEIASAHLARLRRSRWRLHGYGSCAIARAVQFIFRATSHSIDSRRQPRCIQLHNRTAAENLSAVALPRESYRRPRCIVYIGGNLGAVLS